MDITINPAVVGLISSVITEVFKYIPFLRQNALTQAITAIVITGVVAFFANNMVFSLDNVVASLVFALVSYKTLIQPIATTTAMRTQSD